MRTRRSETTALTFPKTSVREAQSALRVTCRASRREPRGALEGLRDVGTTFKTSVAALLAGQAMALEGLCGASLSLGNSEVPCSRHRAEEERDEAAEALVGLRAAGCSPSTSVVPLPADDEHTERKDAELSKVKALDGLWGGLACANASVAGPRRVADTARRKAPALELRGRIVASSCTGLALSALRGEASSDLGEHWLFGASLGASLQEARGAVQSPCPGASTPCSSHSATCLSRAWVFTVPFSPAYRWKRSCISRSLKSPVKGNRWRNIARVTFPLPRMHTRLAMSERCPGK
mmetsp:Transcript_92145/g.298344  ORF Transcript_92145/g.298344 Transcript_92145/m.298344 type:complete len:294 (-) Transcript_92145:573-1454(-)